MAFTAVAPADRIIFVAALHKRNEKARYNNKDHKPDQELQPPAPGPRRAAVTAGQKTAATARVLLTQFIANLLGTFLRFVVISLASQHFVI